MTQPRLREATPRDAPAVADVVFAASYHDALRTGAPPPLENVGAARDLVAALLRVDPFGGLLAEVDGAAVATGWVHARGRVSTLGPVVVAPPWHGRGVGTALVSALLERAGRGAAQVRMLDGGACTTGLAVALRAGFRVVAPVLGLVLPSGRPCAAAEPEDGTIVRAAVPDDRWHVVERDARSFGARRESDVDDALGAGRLVVAERAGRITGYALAHPVGRTLVLGAAAADDPRVVLALVARQVADARPEAGVARLLAPAVDQRLVDLALQAGFRVAGVRAMLAWGGGTPPPKGYLLMPFGRC
jgi:GNAT superfamily N-acetyltransferase